VRYNLAEQYSPEMNWQELTDRELVELCLQGNEDAWREFLRRFQRLLAGVVAKTIRRSPLLAHTTVSIASLIEDGVQDALGRILANNCRALRELEWRHDGALRGLLQITALTAAQDIVRKHMSEKWNTSQEDPLDKPGIVVPDPENTENKLIQKLVRGEPDSTRDIAMFRLYYGCRVTAADLARLHRMNVRKVENTVARLARLARVHCLKSIR
jgi:DNA-directed RNA polymerase specialized sigma24 family protein